jgi:hypothetical protein
MKDFMRIQCHDISLGFKASIIFIQKLSVKVDSIPLVFTASHGRIICPHCTECICICTVIAKSLVKELNDSEEIIKQIFVQELPRIDVKFNANPIFRFTIFLVRSNSKCRDAGILGFVMVSNTSFLLSSGFYNIGN